MRYCEEREQRVCVAVQAKPPVRFSLGDQVSLVHVLARPPSLVVICMRQEVYSIIDPEVVKSCNYYPSHKEVNQELRRQE